MFQATVDYQVHGKTMKGFLAYETRDDQPRPGIVIAPAWGGLDDFAREKAIALAEAGYIAFAADIYGEGVSATHDDHRLQLMLPLFEDRQLLQDRIVGALNELKKQPLTDTRCVGAIGFCFGGLTVLELLRSGADVRGVVCFHALLADTLGEVKAKRLPIADKIKGAALFLHGHDDPLVSEKEIHTLFDELDEARVDWQFSIYGHTLHGFTNPAAQDPNQGTLYNPLIARRAWLAMVNFFQEQFTI